MVRFILKADLIGHYEVKTRRVSHGTGSSELDGDLLNPGGNDGVDNKRVETVRRKYAVYSLDFQPNSYRLATAGGDSCIKIWDTKLLFDRNDDTDGAALQQNCLLATLSQHSKSVNVVRWSKDGQTLASGGDDTCILLFRHTPGAIDTQSFGSNKAKNKESWSRVHILQGHVMDVLDLDWSVHGYIASASIDNNILIWKPAAATACLLPPAKMLSEHTSFVKGLSFDPVGKYLVSSGADNMVIVWDCDEDFTVAKILPDPLRDSLDNTIFRRVAWAPDGQSLCITSALKSGKPVGMVLKRGSWHAVADLVGHTSSSISTRFCPHVLKVGGGGGGAGQDPDKSSGTPTTSTLCCVVALADQTGNLTVWGTHKVTPLYILHDICGDGVTDISWMTVEGSSSGSTTSPTSTSTSISASTSTSTSTSNSNSNRNLKDSKPFVFACCGLDGQVE